jgi:hypothetical protein
MAKKKQFPYLTPIFVGGVVVTKYPANVTPEKHKEIRQKAKNLAMAHSNVYGW